MHCHTSFFFQNVKVKIAGLRIVLYVVRSLCCGYILCTHFEVKSASSEWYCFALCVFTVALKSFEHHSTYCLSLTSFSVFTICVLCRLLLVCLCSCPDVTIMVDWCKTPSFLLACVALFCPLTFSMFTMCVACVALFCPLISFSMFPMCVLCKLFS